MEVGKEFVQILHVKLVLCLNFVQLRDMGVGIGVTQGA